MSPEHHPWDVAPICCRNSSLDTHIYIVCVCMCVCLCFSATTRCFVAAAIVGLHFCCCCLLYYIFGSIKKRLCILLPRFACVCLCVRTFKKGIAVKPIASLDFSLSSASFFYRLYYFSNSGLWLSMLSLLQHGHMEVSTLAYVSSRDARMGQHVNLTWLWPILRHKGTHRFYTQTLCCTKYNSIVHRTFFIEHILEDIEGALYIRQNGNIQTKW